MCESFGAMQVVLCVSQEFCVVSIAIFASASLSPVIIQAEAREIGRISVFLLIVFSF